MNMGGVIGLMGRVREIGSFVLAVQGDARVSKGRAQQSDNTPFGGNLELGVCTAGSGSRNACAATRNFFY